MQSILQQIETTASQIQQLEDTGQVSDNIIYGAYYGLGVMLYCFANELAVAYHYPQLFRLLGWTDSVTYHPQARAVLSALHRALAPGLLTGTLMAAITRFGDFPIITNQEMSFTLASGFFVSASSLLVIAAIEKIQGGAAGALPAIHTGTGLGQALGAGSSWTFISSLSTRSAREQQRQRLKLRLHSLYRQFPQLKPHSHSQHGVSADGSHPLFSDPDNTVDGRTPHETDSHPGQL